MSEIYEQGVFDAGHWAYVVFLMGPRLTDLIDGKPWRDELPTAAAVTADTRHLLQDLAEAVEIRPSDLLTRLDIDAERVRKYQQWIQPEKLSQSLGSDEDRQMAVGLRSLLWEIRQAEKAHRRVVEFRDRPTDWLD